MLEYDMALVNFIFEGMYLYYFTRVQRIEIL